MTPITPVDLSLLLNSHRPVNIPPCRVCGHELDISGMGGDEVTVYACASPDAEYIDKEK